MAGGGGVLERELLGAASARARLQQQQRQRGEEANLILQLGTVVTSTSSLADHVIDSPPNSDPGLQGLAAAAATVQRSHVPRSITESRKIEDHLENTKYRSNNHILPYQFVLQDHNYGAPPPPTPPLSPAPMVQSSSRSMMHHNHHHHGGMHLPPPPLTAQDLCGMAALATVADQVICSLHI
ncbi:hypothetical protein B566_EDAN009705 [Ephemera danica]|nr:hypothetical protein B566_EDAN009705 [Ephemera danica]